MIQDVKISLSILLSLFFVSASACERGTHSELAGFWKNFLPLAIKGEAAKLDKFFMFPVKVYGVHKEMKPLRITERTFLHHYELLFIKNSAEEDLNLHKNLKKYSAGTVFDTSTLQEFDSSGCLKRSFAKIGEYLIYRTKNNEWKIGDIDASSDYEIILSELNFL